MDKNTEEAISLLLRIFGDAIQNLEEDLKELPYPSNLRYRSLREHVWSRVEAQLAEPLKVLPETPETARRAALAYVIANALSEYLKDVNSQS